MWHHLTKRSFGIPIMVPYNTTLKQLHKVSRIKTLGSHTSASEVMTLPRQNAKTIVVVVVITITKT